MRLEFEWDPLKAAGNLAKHGIPFEEARSVFTDPLGIITSDPRHSIDELREALVGLSERGRLVVVMFTERDDIVRIISARPATRRERINYEEGNA